MTAAAVPAGLRAVRSRGDGLGALALRAGVLGYVALLVFIPLTALAASALADGPAGVLRAVSDAVAIDALILTTWTAAASAVIGAFFGTITAWTLVRYRFPGRRLLDAFVDLPFAVPTLVTGMMLVALFGPQRLLGGWLEASGIKVLFASPAIVIALLFVTVPFVVRAVQPVLLEVDPSEEEAARTLGASPWMSFRRVVLPAIAPAILQGTLQAFARALAEFGSIVVVAGNIPHRTLTAPVLIYSEVESGRPEVAAAVSLVLLTLAIGVALTARAIARRRHA